MKEWLVWCFQPMHRAAWGGFFPQSSLKQSQYVTTATQEEVKGFAGKTVRLAEWGFCLTLGSRRQRFCGRQMKAREPFLAKEALSAPSAFQLPLSVKCTPVVLLICLKTVIWRPACMLCYLKFNINKILMVRFHSSLHKLIQILYLQFAYSVPLTTMPPTGCLFQHPPHKEHSLFLAPRVPTVAWAGPRGWENRAERPRFIHKRNACLCSISEVYCHVTGGTHIQHAVEISFVNSAVI